MNEQAQRWQQRFDKDFPDGLVASWVGAPPEHSYHFARVEVVAMHGLNPVVFMDDPEWQKNVTGAVSSYSEVQHTPHLLASVTFEDTRRQMLWNAGLSQLEKSTLAPLRRDSLERSEHGTIYQGARWDDSEGSHLV